MKRFDRKEFDAWGPVLLWGAVIFLLMLLFDGSNGFRGRPDDALLLIVILVAMFFDHRTDYLYDQVKSLTKELGELRAKAAHKASDRV